MIAHLLPRSSPVGGAEETALVVGSFNDQVDVLGVGWRDGNAHAADIHRREPLHDLVPRFAAVGGFVHGRLGSAADLGKTPAPPLLRSGIDHIGIARIHGHIVHSRIFADLQNFFPCFAAVNGFVKSSVAARPPDGTFGRHIYDVRIFGMDNDLADLTRRFQTHVFPRVAAVFRFVNAVAVTQRPLVVVFARTQPHHVGIVGVNGNVSHGIGSVIVENGHERCTVVFGFPNMSRCGSHKIFAVIFGVDRKIGNPPRRKGRSDASPFQSREGSRLECVGLCAFIFFLFSGFRMKCCQNKCHRHNQCRQTYHTEPFQHGVREMYLL